MKKIQIVPANEEPVEDDQTYKRGYLALPFEEDQFKEFIVGLLGKQQTFDKTYFGDFEIELKDIQHINELLSQRIFQQNAGKLVQFIGTLFFSDNSSVTLSTYAGFMTYNELKPVICTAVALTWIYLIQFPDKKVPERQEINLRIFSSDQPIEVPGSDYKRYPDQGRFQTSVQYTARTWGYDIETLLQGEINKLKKKQDKVRNYVKENGGLIALAFGLISWSASLIFTFFNSRKFIKTESEKIHEFIKGSNVIEKKIDYLLEYTSSGLIPQYFFNVGNFVFISLIFCLFIAIWIFSRTENLTHKKSFVLLTNNTYIERDKVRIREKREWIWFVISLILGLSLEILGNYLYDIFT